MNQDDSLKDKIYSRFNPVIQPSDAGEDSDATAETRSAPGDLVKLPDDDIVPGPSGEQDSYPDQGDGSSIASSTPRRTNQSVHMSAQQKRGHLRGTRSNGFAQARHSRPKSRRKLLGRRWMRGRSSIR